MELRNLFGANGLMLCLLLVDGHIRLEWMWGTLKTYKDTTNELLFTVTHSLKFFAVVKFNYIF